MGRSFTLQVLKGFDILPPPALSQHQNQNSLPKITSHIPILTDLSRYILHYTPISSIFLPNITNLTNFYPYYRYQLPVHITVHPDTVNHQSIPISHIQPYSPILISFSLNLINSDPILT